MMDAGDDTPRGGKNGDGAQDESVARGLFDEELADADAAIDRTVTVAIRNGRADLVEELAEHLRDLAGYLEEKYDEEGVASSRLSPGDCEP